MPKRAIAGRRCRSVFPRSTSQEENISVGGEIQSAWWAFTHKLLVADGNLCDGSVTSMYIRKRALEAGIADEEGREQKYLYSTSYKTMQ